jgi:predicted HTH domain antitoxin
MPATLPNTNTTSIFEKGRVPLLFPLLFLTRSGRRLASAVRIWQTAGMELTLPKPLDERLSQEDTALHLAIGLFVTEEATLGQAAQTAGLSQADFLRELGRRRIPIHYGHDELAADLQAVESFDAR